MLSVVEYGSRRTLIVVGVMLAALLQTLDATIVNVALPTIEGNIGASLDDGTWIVTGYIIANVIAIPLAPYLMQVLGRRQYYAICIAGFTIASALCGTADALPVLVLYRVVQGAFGGGLVATAQIVLRDTYPPQQIGKSSALFAIALTVGPALGPTMGGILTDHFSWQWIFDINLVPGAIAFAIVALVLRNPAPGRRVPFDAAGMALLAFGLGALQFVLDEGERNDWFSDPAICAAAAASVFGLAAFTAWELRGAHHPIVDLRVFRFATVRAGVALALLEGIVIFGPTFLLPQYVQANLGFSATLSGLLILMRALPVVVITPFVAGAIKRVDARLLQVGGLVLSAIAFFAIAQRITPQSNFAALAIPLVLAGAAQSALIVPLLVSVLGPLGPADAPKASAFISLFVQLGGSVSSTGLITLFDRRTFFHAEVERTSLTLANPAVAAFLHGGGNAVQLSGILAQQATTGAFADAIDALVPVALISTVLVCFLRPHRAGTRR